MKRSMNPLRAALGFKPWFALALVSAATLATAACESTELTPVPAPDCEKTPDHELCKPGTNPGEVEFGDVCTKTEDCEEGLFCTTLSSTSENAFCLLRCSEQSECSGTTPRSTCTSVTTQQGSFAQACVPSDFCFDKDGDGYGEGPGCTAFDCNDNDPNIHPGAHERCNGIDDNCNNVIDDSPIDSNIPCETGLPGECQDGRVACVLGQSYCNPVILPDSRTEICDGKDNDCDGRTDEGPDGFDTNFIEGLGLACGAAGDGCYAGLTICNPDTRRIECDGDIQITDVPDLCNYIDDNCDGTIDEDVTHPNFGNPCTVGQGTCRANGIIACVPNDPAATPVCNAVPNMDNASPEICDYNDNNCDGVTDEGFYTLVGGVAVYNKPEHCGSCGNSCLDRWQPNPQAFGVVPSCRTSGITTSCGFDCMPGRVDLDLVADNGCEFEPDLGAVYVASPTNSARPGTDNSTCGTYNAPCATIAHAFTRANVSTRPRIRVSEGSFAGGFDLVNGISVLGAHSARNWTRLKNSTGQWANVTTLSGGKVSGADAYAIKANNITATTELSGFTIEAPDAAGAAGNSIGIWIVNSNQSLTIQDNTILGGRGGVGLPGAAGNNGTSGPAGLSGHDRVYDVSSCTNSINNNISGAGDVVMLGGAGGANTCGGTSVRGGSGAPTTCPKNEGVKINNNPTEQGRAFNGEGPSTPRGQGGISTWHQVRGSISYGIFGCSVVSGDPPSPEAGTPGANGQSGNGGAAAANNLGAVSAGMWRGAEGGTGQGGVAGSGGGGGGSSGGAVNDDDKSSPKKAFHYGPTGGGGGAGGCAGTGATGGKGGGASFGIFATFSTSPTAATRPVIEGNNISRGQGGRGGQGGLGGVGGDGGAGGVGGAQQTSPNKGWSRCGQNAAPGGPGGRGGHGGGGGGGAGGISYDIVVGGATSNALDVYRDANTYTVPDGTATGGQGGAGGGAIANPGAAGPTGASGNFRRF